MMDTVITILFCFVLAVMIYAFGYSMGVLDKRRSERKPEKPKGSVGHQDPSGTMFYFGTDDKIHSIPPKPKK